MEQRDKTKLTKDIDNALNNLETLIQDSRELIVKLKGIRDTLTGQTKLDEKKEMP